MLLPLLLPLLLLQPAASLNITITTPYPLPPTYLHKCLYLLSIPSPTAYLAALSTPTPSSFASKDLYTLTPACSHLYNLATTTPPLPHTYTDAILDKYVPRINPCPPTNPPTPNSTYFRDHPPPTPPCSLRLIPPAPTNDAVQPTPYRGYGITLVFKDLEYLTINDEQERNEQEKEEGERELEYGTWHKTDLARYLWQATFWHATYL